MDDRMSRAESRRDKHKTKSKTKNKRWLLIVVICLLLLTLPSAIIMTWNYFFHDFSSSEPIEFIPEDEEIEDLLENPDTEEASELDVPNSSEANEPDSSNDEKEIISPDDHSEQAELPKDDSGRIQLTFVGDVLLGSTVNNLLERHGMEYPYQYVKELLQNPDITVANLETPVTTRGEAVENKAYTYRSSPETLPAFSDAGFDIVTLANNHILDYGIVGMQDTFKHLEDAGIRYVGAGNDDSEAYQHVIIEENGIKIAFLGFSQVVPAVEWKANRYNPGVAETYSYERPVEAIKTAKAEADIVVVLPHWGNPYREQNPEQQQVNMAHRYIDAGADLVMGSHPHVLQTIETYKDKWIVYSLGNFIFTTNKHKVTWEGAILNASCEVSGYCELELLPVWNNGAQPKQMEVEDAMRVFKGIVERSTDIVIDQDGKIVKPAG